MLQYSFLFIVKEIIIFMTSCKLVVGNHKGLYNANIWMSTALWGISGNESNSCEPILSNREKILSCEKKVSADHHSGKLMHTN